MDYKVGDWIVLPNTISGLKSYLAKIESIQGVSAQVKTLADEQFGTDTTRIKQATIFDYLRTLNATELVRYMFRLATYFASQNLMETRFDDVEATKYIQKQLTDEKLQEVRKLING